MMAVDEYVVEDRALLAGLTDEALIECIDRREKRYVAASDDDALATEAALARANAEQARRERDDEDD